MLKPFFSSEFSIIIFDSFLCFSNGTQEPGGEQGSLIFLNVGFLPSTIHFSATVNFHKNLLSKAERNENTSFYLIHQEKG